MCLVNKRLRNLAEPFLYSAIKWTWTETQVPPVIIFLSTILSRPELCLHVRSVHLEGDTFYNAPFRGKLPPTIPVVDTELGTIVASAKEKFPDHDRWQQYLMSGTMDPLIALMLSYLPNLTSLRLSPNFAKQSTFLGIVLRAALCEPNNPSLPRFERLRDVFFDCGVDSLKHMVNTIDVLPLFYLPAVSNISVGIDNPDTVFEWPGGTPPGTSEISALSLAGIRELHLGQILSVTKSLNSFRWFWYYNPNIYNPSNASVIELDQIASALLHVQDTLTECTISAECDYRYGEGDFPALEIKGSLQSLSGFDSLKKLGNSVAVPSRFLA